MSTFVEELQALLEKYNATIEWRCGECSDLHGVYDERMAVYSGDKDLLEINGSCINAYDLKLQGE